MDRQTDWTIDGCRSAERERGGVRQQWCLSAGLSGQDYVSVCPRQSCSEGGLGLQTCSPAGLPLAAWLSSSQTLHWTSSRTPTHLHLVLCTNYSVIHVEKHEFIWRTEPMSCSLLTNMRVSVLKMAVIDMLWIHIFHHHPPALTSAVRPDKFQHLRARILLPQILSSVPGAASLDEQHEVWHIFVPVSLIDRGWILLNCAGELAQILLKF